MYHFDLTSSSIGPTKFKDRVFDNLVIRLSRGMKSYRRWRRKDRYGVAIYDQAREDCGYTFNIFAPVLLRLSIYGARFVILYHQRPHRSGQSLHPPFISPLLGLLTIYTRPKDLLIENQNASLKLRLDLFLLLRCQISRGNY